MRTTIEGELVELRIVTPDFWGPAKVRTDRDGTIAVTGKWVGVELGQRVKVVGAWSNHPRYGRQLRAYEVEASAPTTVSGVVAWMAARLHGVGRRRAVQLIEHFGGVEELWAVLEEAPERVAEVKGISPQMAAQIGEAYATHRGERDRAVRLRSWGLTDTEIAKVFERWGQKGEEELRRDPYQLIAEIREFGFKKADRIARRMGMPSDAPPRIRAALVHVLEEAAAEGHTYLDAQAWIRIAARLLGAAPSDVTKEAFIIRDAGLVIGGEGRARLPKIQRAELAVANVVRRMVEDGAEEEVEAA